jgi:hypothetical protein
VGYADADALRGDLWVDDQLRFVFNML